MTSPRLRQLLFAVSLAALAAGTAPAVSLAADADPQPSVDAADPADPAEGGADAPVDPIEADRLAGEEALRRGSSGRFIIVLCRPGARRLYLSVDITGR